MWLILFIFGTTYVEVGGFINKIWQFLVNGLQMIDCRYHTKFSFRERISFLVSPFNLSKTANANMRQQI